MQANPVNKYTKNVPLQDCLETSGTNCPVMRWHIQEEQRPPLQDCESLKTHTIHMLTVTVVAVNCRYTIFDII
jgi:hypothetical protein